MVPFTPDGAPGLSSVAIFLAAGQRDPIEPAANTNDVAKIFRSGGAEVTVHWHTGGHELGRDDLDAASMWMSKAMLSG
jgi:phospholipase/carboxylesterase